MKILIIEDIRLSSLMVEHMLKGLGHSVLSARTGQEAIEQMENETGIEAVICDYHLPDLTAFEVFQPVKKLKRYNVYLPPFVLLTANKSPQLFRQAEHLGFAAMLNKPFEPEKLREILNSIEAGYYVLEKEATENPVPVVQSSAILLVDDIHFHSVLTQSILKRSPSIKELNISIITAMSGTEALDKLHANPNIILVITDLVLPDFDGVAIRQHYQEKLARNYSDAICPPFWLLTISNNFEDTQCTNKSGFTEVFHKPLHPEPFMESLEQFLKAHHGQIPNQALESDETVNSY